MRLAICCFFLLAQLTAAAQNTVTDSLKRLLATTPADTSRVLLLNSLCWQLGTQDAVQAQRYGQQSLALARRLGFRLGEVYSLSSLARVAYFQQDDVAAIGYYQQAVQRAEQEPRAARQLTLALLGLGRVATQQHDFAEGARYFHQALDRMQQRRHAVTAVDIGMGQNHLAVLYFDWLRSGKPAPDSIARLHEKYARLVLKTFRRLGSAEQLAASLNSMGQAHQLAGRYDSAAYCQQEAFRLYQRIGNSLEMAQTQQSLAEVRLAQHRWAEAAALLRPTIGQGRALHATGVEAHGYQLLARALAELGQGGEAYQLAQAGQVLLDSLQSTERREALARLQVQFDTERQRNRVRTLTQLNRLQEEEARKQQQQVFLLGALLVAVVAGLVGSGLLAWRLRRSQALLARQNAELTATRTEQDRLYALVAHDLRSPVIAFTGLADLLTYYVERQDTVRLARLGGRVRQAAEGLRELLENLLSWALNQRGELVAKTESLSVALLLAEAAELYQPSAEAAGIELSVGPGPDWAVQADPNMARTILRNLISNALRATPAGGTITLSATQVAAGVAIQVRDTGVGMAPAVVQQVLTAPMAQVAGRQGTAGLGLRLSRSFALAQAGQLTLLSLEGEGTTAILTLPLATVGEVVAAK